MSDTKSATQAGANRPTAYNKALDLLARRSHFRRELAHKLATRGYPEDEIEATLERLAERRFLDDRETARQWLEARRSRGPEGRRRLAAELARRGADSDVIDEVLAEALPEDDRPAAREAAERWLARRSGDPSPQALARHLERKGFASGTIWALLEELGMRGGGGGRALEAEED